jgi:hypothetical protein
MINNLELELELDYDYDYIIDNGYDEKHYAKCIYNKINYFKEYNKIV